MEYRYCLEKAKGFLIMLTKRVVLVYPLNNITIT